MSVIGRIVDVSPGAILRATLRERGMTQLDLARAAGLTPSHISGIVHARVRITAATALALERALDIPARDWLYRQADHDLIAAARTPRVQ